MAAAADVTMPSEGAPKMRTEDAEGQDAEKTVSQPSPVAGAEDAQPKADAAPKAKAKAKARRVLKNNLKSSEQKEGGSASNDEEGRGKGKGRGRGRVGKTARATMAAKAEDASTSADNSKPDDDAALAPASAPKGRGKGRGGRGRGRKASTVADADTTSTAVAAEAPAPEAASAAVSKKPAAAVSTDATKAVPQKEVPSVEMGTSDGALSICDYAVVVGVDSEEMSLNGMTGFVQKIFEGGKRVELRIGDGACVTFKAEFLRKLTFKPHDVVRLHGLTTDVGKSLNGSTAIVKGYNLEKDRYEVRFGIDIRTFKAENLGKVSAESKASPANSSVPAPAPTQSGTLAKARAAMAKGKEPILRRPAKAVSDTASKPVAEIASGTAAADAVEPAKPVLKRPAKAVGDAASEPAVEIASDTIAADASEPAKPVLRRPASAVAEKAAEATVESAAEASASAKPRARKPMTPRKPKDTLVSEPATTTPADATEPVAADATPAPKRTRGARKAATQENGEKGDAALQVQTPSPSAAEGSSTPAKDAQVAAPKRRGRAAKTATVEATDGSAPKADSGDAPAANAESAAADDAPLLKRKRAAPRAKKDVAVDSEAKPGTAAVGDPVTPPKGTPAPADAPADDSATKPAAKRRRKAAEIAEEAKPDPAVSEAEALGYGTALRNLAGREAITAKKISMSQMLAALKDADGLVNKAKDALLATA